MGAPKPLFDHTPQGFYDGPYVGFGAGGFSAGVLTFDGRFGNNWTTPIGHFGVVFGAEASLGLQVPSNTFALWGNFKVGEPLANNVLLYGTAGLGIIGGTPVYDLGGGLTVPLSQGLSLDLRGLTRGLIGAAPKEVGFNIGLDWKLKDLGLGGFNPVGHPADKFGFGAAGEEGPQLLAGASLGVVSTGAVIPGVSAQYWLPVQNGIDFGLRGNAGLQLPTGRPELWGGLQVGTEIVDGKYIYGFADLGVISSTPVNSIGGGALLDLPYPGFKLGGEVFGRGALGTISEAGARFSVFRSIPLGPPPPPPPPP